MSLEFLSTNIPVASSMKTSKIKQHQIFSSLVELATLHMPEIQEVLVVTPTDNEFIQNTFPSASSSIEQLVYI